MMGIRRLLAAACISIAMAVNCNAQNMIFNQLSAMSLQQLGDIEVTSVSKRAEPINKASSAIYVISHDDVLRSGATTLPEMLKLAPNLQIAQTSASNYVITARGLSGNTDAQSFPNKLLVLIDGRSVYTPLFSGVYWDMLDVLPEDIERIEVISGPGATLWGANAINGVINVITRSSKDTTGGVADMGAGDQARRAALRYGGQINDDLTARVYVQGLGIDGSQTTAGASAQDNWSKYQGGFRLDWAAIDNVITVQGDAYRGTESQSANADEDIDGRNLLARWTRKTGNDSELRVQGYYDAIARADAGGHFLQEAYDLDLQHSVQIQRHELIWGGGYRATRYRIVGNAGLQFAPMEGTLNLSNFYVQDGVALTKALKLTLGLKFEVGPYAKPVTLPNLRLAWSPNNQWLVWSAASRAIRSATPFDRDVVESIGSTVFLTGSPTFRSEKLTAYELGIRMLPSSRATLSLSTFYNSYDDLRSIEVAPGGFLPLRWGNLMQGHTYGLETWGEYRMTPWWRLRASYNLLRQHLKFKPGASGLLGTQQAGNDPPSQASLTSSMNLGTHMTMDASMRYVDALPDPHVPAYVELNSRIAWKLSDRMQLSVSGFNLLHDHHQEWGSSSANVVARSYLANLQWLF